MCVCTCAHVYVCLHVLCCVMCAGPHACAYTRVVLLFTEHGAQLTISATLAGQQAPRICLTSAALCSQGGSELPLHLSLPGPLST